MYAIHVKEMVLMNHKKSGMFFLEIIGIAMILIPFIFLIIISINHFIEVNHLLIDFLLPAELSFVIMPGALIITLIAMKTHNHFKVKSLLFLISIITILMIMFIPSLAGFGNDASLARGFWFIVTISATIVYDLATFILCIFALVTLKI